MFNKKTLGELLLVAGLWLIASATMAAPQPGPDMPLGQAALPPEGYVAFCERKPLDCGSDAGLVLARAAQSNVDRAQLLAMAEPAKSVASAPAALAPTDARSPATTPAFIRLAAPLFKAPAPFSASITRAAFVSEVAFTDPAALPEDRAAPEGPPRMSPWLWSTLNRVNAEVNGAIRQQTDEQTYGVEDYWNTPLEDGRHAGDCEDFALEKMRQLIAAGVPRRAINMALVVTRWGEAHAVVLVSTTDGEYVLDSLSPWVVTWRRAPYTWVRREVDGDPFRWVMVAPAANAPKPRLGGFLIAFNR